MRRHDMYTLKAITLCFQALDMRTPTALDASLEAPRPRYRAYHGWRRGACRLTLTGLTEATTAEITVIEERNRR